MKKNLSAMNFVLFLGMVGLVNGNAVFANNGDPMDGSLPQKKDAPKSGLKAKSATNKDEDKRIDASKLKTPTDRQYNNLKKVEKGDYAYEFSGDELKSGPKDETIRPRREHKYEREAWIDFSTPRVDRQKQKQPGYSLMQLCLYGYNDKSKTCNPNPNPQKKLKTVKLEDKKTGKKEEYVVVPAKQYSEGEFSWKGTDLGVGFEVSKDVYDQDGKRLMKGDRPVDYMGVSFRLNHNMEAFKVGPQISEGGKLGNGHLFVIQPNLKITQNKNQVDLGFKAIDILQFENYQDHDGDGKADFANRLRIGGIHPIYFRRGMVSAEPTNGGDIRFKKVEGSQEIGAKIDVIANDLETKNSKVSAEASVIIAGAFGDPEKDDIPRHLILDSELKLSGQHFVLMKKKDYGLYVKASGSVRNSADLAVRSLEATAAVGYLSSVNDGTNWINLELGWSPKVTNTFRDEGNKMDNFYGATFTFGRGVTSDKGHSSIQQ